MNVQIASDIHIEKLYPETPKITNFITPVDGVDTLILAGDIGSIYHSEALKFFLLSCKEHFTNVIYVPGNNEYYERPGFEPVTFAELESRLKELCKYCEVILLNNSYIETDEFVIFGSVWWSHIPDVLTMKIYKAPGIPIDSDDFNHMHNASRRCLNTLIGRLNGKKLIVITHYCPTRFGTMNMYHRKTEFEPLTPYYFSSSEKFLRSGAVNMWIFGHTHVFRDFYFENTRTRLISNADPRKKVFRKNFTVSFQNDFIEKNSS
jgi:predicted phosphodiesterase